MQRHIHFPDTPADRRKLIAKNYERYPYIPGVLGFVDGSHFPIVAPIVREDLYTNRKQVHSLNTQICCDVDYIILNIVPRFPGANHDSFIWNSSGLSATMERIYRGGEQCWLLGDSGYPHQPWLQTPVLRAAQGTREANYTKAHMICRSSVERAIGHLKSRFRCLCKHRTLHYEPEKAGKIIISCAVLHNLCIAARLPLPEDEDDGDENLDEDDAAHFNEQMGLADAPRPLLQEARVVRGRLIVRTSVVPPADRVERRHHRRGVRAVRQ